MTYHWPGRPFFGLKPDAAAGHAVVLSWHVAPDLTAMPGQDRMLAIWAEPLLDALAEVFPRVTLLILAPEDSGPAEALAEALRPRGIGLHVARGLGPMARALAVDRALEELAPDMVHAPERGGLLACALARRAAGLAHLDTVMLLHARGPTLFQMEEQACFIADAQALRLDEMERQAMRLADAVLASGAEVARAIAAGPQAPALHGVGPLVWPAPARPPAPLNELVFPLPLGSEAGLEFAVAALARASARRPFPLPVTFLGQPDAVTLGDAAQALARLGEHLDWRVAALESPQQALQYLAAPGRLALFTAARATPPEWLEFCGAAGIPALATENHVTARAARRWPCIHVVARAERPFAAALEALPCLPEAAPPALQAASRLGQPPSLTGWRRPAAAALALLSEPASPDLTLFCPPRGGLLDSLAAQSLACFATTILLAEGEAPPQPERPPGRPVRIESAALPEALAACTTRYAVLVGGAHRLRPGALLALRRAALATGAPAIAAWDSASMPLGGGADLALLRPGATIGHLVLLDLTALRAGGGGCLALAGTPAFAGALAEESDGVRMLPEILADAATPPPRPDAPALAGLPPRLRGVAGMALHYAGLVVPPREAREPDIPAAMAVANRDSAHYRKLMARLMERAGQPEAAAQAWAALVARGEADAEVWERHAGHAMRRHGHIAEFEAFRAHVERHGPGDLAEGMVARAAALRREGKAREGFALLLGLAPALQRDAVFIAALAAGFAGLPPAERSAVVWPILEPTPGQALQQALAAHGLAGVGEAAP